MSEASQVISLICTGKLNDLNEVCQRVGRIISSEFSGGQSEDCSYVIFLLMNRVFGEDATGRSRALNTISDTWSKGVSGGWLLESCSRGITSRESSARRRSISEVPAITGMSTKDVRISSDAIQLLRLFSGSGTSSVLRILSRLLPCDDVAISVFPPKIRMKLLNRVEYECVSSSNHFIYDEWYCGPDAYQTNYLMDSFGASEPAEEDVLLSMDMFSYFLITYLRYPTVDNDSVFPRPQSFRAEETFDLFFAGEGGGAGGGWMGSGGGGVRHMLSMDPEIPLLAALRCEGKAAWIRGNPYLILLEHYLDTFLPTTTAASVRTPGADGDHGNARGVGDGLSRRGELFLRLAIDFWIDTAPVVRYHYNKVSFFKDVLKQRSFRSSMTSTANNASSISSSGGRRAGNEMVESAATKVDRLGAGGGSVSGTSARERLGDSDMMVANDHYAFEALGDSRRDAFTSQTKLMPVQQQGHPGESMTESMAAGSVPTYDVWYANSAPTSAGPTGSVPITKPPSCTEVHLLSHSLTPIPTKSTLQCVYLLVSHVLTDISVDHFRQLGPGSSTMRWGPRGEDQGGYAMSALPLPPAVQMLQQPVFDLLRSLLSRKEKLDRTTYHLVVRIWQLWLTPWDQKALAQQSANLMTAERQSRSASSRNTMAAAARTVTRAVSGVVTLGDSSRQFGAGYDDSWRPYVAANLHFYTTLHVLFLRSMAQRDLSTNLTALLHILDNTLRIFTPELIRDIDTLSAGYLFFLNRLHSNDGTGAPVDYNKHVDETVLSAYLQGMQRGDDDSLRLDTVEFDAIRLQHVNLFPDPSMADPAEAIVHYRAEAMEAAISISDFLHRLSVVPRSVVGNVIKGIMINIIDPIFHTQTRRSDRPSRVKEMCALLRDMFFMRDFVGTPDSRGEDGGRERRDGRGRDTFTSRERDVFNRGNLTATGRRQLVEGKYICDKEFIQFRGDLLDRPLRSDEFEPLAKLMVYWSKRLNTRFNLPEDKRTVSLTWTTIMKLHRSQRFQTAKCSVRFNLRFLATLHFLCVVALCLVYMAYRWNWLRGIQFALVAVGIAGLFSRGSFSGLLPWRSY